MTFFDMITKRLLLLALASMITVGSFAQSGDYRSKGYKGSVSFTDQMGVWLGLETSHGYMFNEHHYLGGGVGGFILPKDICPTFGGFFVDYHAYLLDRPSTPVLGVKAGFTHAFNYKKNDSGFKFRNAVTFEPGAAWSWGLDSGYGLTLGLSAQMYVYSHWRSLDLVELKGSIMPKLSVSFEF